MQGKTGARKDPSLVAFFKIEIDGMQGDNTFSRCVGLKSETQVFEYREGGLNEQVHKLLGPTSHSNVILTQGHISDPAMHKWFDEITSGSSKTINRRNGAIVALAADGKTEVDRWDFVGANIVRWEHSDHDANSHEVATETVELAVQKLTHSR